MAFVSADPLNDESENRWTLISGCGVRRSCHTKSAKQSSASGACQKKPAPTGLFSGSAAYNASVRSANPAVASSVPSQSSLTDRRGSPPARISGQSAQKSSAATGMFIQKIQVQPNDDAGIRPPQSGPTTLPTSSRALTAPSTGLRAPAG